MLSKLLPILRSAFVCTLSLIATASVAQTTILVGPGQTYTTIQSGIDAAVNGDTVLVAPGTYNENINFKGKAITVTSSGGKASTIIDGGYKPGLATVVFANAETSASVISGFTIRGGGDTIFTGTSDGGVYVGSASATIRDNIITANYCHNIEVLDGYATIFGNEVSGVLQSNGQAGSNESYCNFGSGIHLRALSLTANGIGTTVIANLIQNNLTGSALNLWAANDVLIMGNVIRNNTSPDPGSAYTEANSVGVILVQNFIYENVSKCGGAIAFMFDPFIANNVIVNNTTPAVPSGGSECTAIAQIYPGPYAYGSSNPAAVIVNNIISGSTSDPAVNCSWFEAPSEARQPTFRNNVLYNAGGPFFGSHCIDVSGKYGNITSDPQFVNSMGDFHLQRTSPAIDSGDNSVVKTLTDQPGLDFSKDAGGNPRVQDATGKGCVIDIGAYEYTGTVSDCAGIFETLISSLNPAQAGQTVTFTAQLSASSGTPTGLIEFLDGTTLLASQAVSSTGSAAFTTNTLTVGSHPITANYQPTGNFGASTASLTQVITGFATSTALTCLPNPIDIANIAQFTAAVTSTSGTPTGSIAFADNTTVIATKALTNGAATLAYTGTTAGTHTIIAAYQPTGSFAQSAAASCSEVVNPLPTTSTLTVAPTTATYGSPITLTATVTPTGIVTFLNGASVLGTGTLAGGVATLASSGLHGGGYNLTCMYSGSAIYSTSNCNPIPVVIQAAPTTLTLTASKNPSSFPGIVAFTSQLSVNGRAAPAGNTIQLTINGKTILLTTDPAGTAVYNVGNLVPASYPVSATFTATGDLLASSASLTEVITPAPTTISLSGTPNPGDLNQSITFTATVFAPGNPNPPANGSVTFYDGSTSLGSSVLSSTGTANLTASFSTLGVHNITARYSGSEDFTSSTSAAFSETIVAGDFSIAVSPASATFFTGQSAETKVTVTSLQGFNQSIALTCSGLPANASCSFNPALLSNGQGASKLVIRTAAPHKAVSASGFVSGSTAALGALTLLLLPGWRRPRRLLAGLSLLLLAVGIATGTSGCASVHSITGGTPPGTYHVAVTATTAGAGTVLSHYAVVTLTVKSLF